VNFRFSKFKFRIASERQVVAGRGGQRRFTGVMGALRRGFTLIELLATLVLIGLVMPVAMQVVTLCTGLSGQSRHRLEAATLGRSKLCELIASGQWQTGGAGGDFGDNWEGYRWSMSQAAWSDPVVSQIDVTVVWAERGRERTLTLSTLAYPEEE